MTGGSPRYNIYRTADDRFVAAAPIEDRFWEAFCELTELDESLRDDARNPDATRRAVADRIRSRTAEEWCERFKGADVCCTLVRDLREAVDDDHFRARGLFDWHVASADGEHEMPALPLPLAPGLRAPPASVAAPALESQATAGGGNAR